MDRKKYLVVHADALPDVYKKVVEAKEMIKNGDATGVSEAVKAVGISRSTYYKYSDHVFSLAEGALVRRSLGPYCFIMNLVYCQLYWTDLHMHIVIY